MLTQPDIDALEEKVKQLSFGIYVDTDVLCSDILRITNELRLWRSSKEEEIVKELYKHHQEDLLK